MDIRHLLFTESAAEIFISLDDNIKDEVKSRKQKCEPGELYVFPFMQYCRISSDEENTVPIAITTMVYAKDASCKWVVTDVSIVDEDEYLDAIRETNYE